VVTTRWASRDGGGLDRLLSLPGRLRDTSNRSTGSATTGSRATTTAATAATSALGLQDVVKRRVELVLGVGRHIE
jgi:hypothetical protein